MIRRLILTAALAALPVAALADDAATLGPSTNSAVGGTADPGTSSLLQPAGTSTLQPSGEQGSGVTQAPADSNLQPAGSADANQSLLVTEASGAQHDLTDSADSITWPLFAGLGAAFVLVLITLLVVENRRLRALSTANAEPWMEAGDPDSAETNNASAEPEKSQDEAKPEKAAEPTPETTDKPADQTANDEPQPDNQAKAD